MAKCNLRFDFSNCFDFDIWRPESTLEKCKQALLSHSIVLVKGIPPSEESFFRIGAKLGHPMRKYSQSQSDSIDQYLGKVKNTLTASGDAPMPTQGHGPINMHTARSYSSIRPDYFALLAKNEGFPLVSAQTSFVALADAIEEFKRREGETWPSSLDLLSSVKVLYGPKHVKEGVCDVPILERMEDGTYVFRYWEEIMSGLESTVISASDRPHFVAILERFNRIVNSPDLALQHLLKNGEMILIDNRRVAHGRTGFTPYLSSDLGEKIFNPRELISMHLQSASP